MTVCEKDKCTGCMACVDICPKNAVTIKDDILSYNALIDEELCVNCGACRKVCQNNQEIAFAAPNHWYQGWAQDDELREKGSSGGVASAVIRGFIENGGYVCSCVFKNGAFGFEITNDAGDVSKFRGSKYVKSDPAGVYKQIRALLQNDKQVLFIGFPCQAEAVRQFVGEKLFQRLYTVDLICHGSPSPKVLEIYLKQHGQSLKKLKDIKFRVKGQFWLSDGYKSVTKSGIQDSYLIAFLNGISYTENCYACKYARPERISDLTLGDSWGSRLGPEEVRKGISLILCQNEKGRRLLEMGKIHLENVDRENAIANNGQLKHPSAKPKKRQKFMNSILAGCNFDRTVFTLLPKKYFRQIVKTMLIKLHVIHRGGGYKITVTK